jgi:RNA polymerase sigma factor (sigma-70 family)
MDPMGDRSKDVTTASTATLPATAVRALDFDALYRDARDDVFAYTATLLRDSAAAEDVTAQAFERAYKRRSRFDARRGSPRAWLFGIARNAALDELRRRKRAATLAAEPTDVDAPAPEDEADLALRRAAVRTALAGLPPRERELIALKFHAGLDNAELAKVLGVSVTNAGTLLCRAMRKLRKAIDEHA